MLPLLFVCLVRAEPSSNIRVGLFANHPFHRLTVDGYGGLRVSGQRAQGSLTITLQAGKVRVRDQKNLDILAPSVTVASRAGRWLDLKTDDRRQKRTVGWLEINAKSPDLQVVDVVPLETYVLGVVDGELGSVHFNPESLKAQIVASRSYVLASRGRHAKEGFDFCDSPHCQSFKGTGAIENEFKMAVEMSRGQYLSYNGKPIPAYYHDSCGGKTASIQDVWDSSPLPYLQSVQDGDREGAYCRFSPHAQWTFVANRHQLCDCFQREGWIPTSEALDAVRVIMVNASGRAQQVLIQSSHPLWVPGPDVRAAINRYFGKEVLSSTVFLVKKQGDQFYFSGRGWGHGVGLCQWGAIEMAKKGKTYREILQHYYPGTQIERLPEPQYASVGSDDTSTKL